MVSVPRMKGAEGAFFPPSAGSLLPPCRFNTTVPDESHSAGRHLRRELQLAFSPRKLQPRSVRSLRTRRRAREEKKKKANGTTEAKAPKTLCIELVENLEMTGELSRCFLAPRTKKRQYVHVSFLIGWMCASGVNGSAPTFNLCSD